MLTKEQILSEVKDISIQCAVMQERAIRLMKEIEKSEQFSAPAPIGKRKRVLTVEQQLQINKYRAARLAKINGYV